MEKKTTIEAFNDIKEAGKKAKEEIIETIDVKPRIDEIKGEMERSFLKIYQFELKPRWWQIWAFGRRLNDRIIATPDCKITWLGGNRYQVIILRTPAVFYTDKELKGKDLKVEVKTVEEGFQDVGEN